LPLRRAALSILILLIVAPGCTGLKETRRAKRIGLEWVTVPGITFVMGDTIMIENPDALPLHEVEIAPFEISRYETTYAQYDDFARATRGRMPEAIDDATGDHAVSDVDWDDARAFCEWIGARLPAESEWEYAAGGWPDKMAFAGTNFEENVGEYVLYRKNAPAHPSEVGQKLPNRFGLYDMSGNVAEWIGAYYQYYPEPGEQPAKYDLEQFDIRIVRGGSYSMDLEVARTYWRAGTLKDVTSPAIGFRCAR
jgi:formylglycine-generating enzyme required for sulfatase activity